jgi:hypothetical protein
MYATWIRRPKAGIFGPRNFLALDAYAIVRRRDAVPGVGEEVIRRAPPELVAGTQFTADIEAQGSNTERD